MIRAVRPSDAAAIAEIYNHYILHAVATFEEQPVEIGEMEQRLASASEAHPWLVFEEAGRVVGYAYASPWKSRCSYRFSKETSVYLHHECTGRGIGKALYVELIARLRKLGYHTLIGGITLPNPASVALHESLGFRPCAEFHQVGYKFDTWLDVGYWELLLEDSSD